MYAKFKNGVVKECTAPTEQMIFKNNEPVGWLAVLAVKDVKTSDEAESLLANESISSMRFFNTLPVDDDTEPMFALNGYTAVQSAVVYHNSDNSFEVQLKKPLSEVTSNA